MHHSHTTYSVCFRDSQCICFNPIYCSWEQWREVQSFQLINHTWVSDSNKPVSVLWCVSRNSWKHRAWAPGGASLGKDLRLNDKYICPKDNSGTYSCVYYKQLYCPCWVMKGGQLSLKGRSIPHIQLPLFYKKGSNPDCTLAACSPVNFTIFNLNYTVWEAGEKSDI
jgi:hypothetical protein